MYKLWRKTGEEWLTSRLIHDEADNKNDAIIAFLRHLAAPTLKAVSTSSATIAREF